MGWRVNSTALCRVFFCVMSRVLSFRVPFSAICVLILDVLERTKSGDFHHLTFVAMVTLINTCCETVTVWLGLGKYRVYIYF